MGKIRQNPSWNSPRQTDAVMLMAVVLAGAANVCIGYFYGRLMLAAELAALFLAAGLLAFFWQRGRDTGRLLLTLSACGMVGALVVLAAARRRPTWACSCWAAFCRNTETGAWW